MDTEDFDDSKMSDDENPKSPFVAENVYHFSEPGERLLQKRRGRKARKLFDWLYLDGCIDWEGLIWYLWLVILWSLFINLEAFQT